MSEIRVVFYQEDDGTVPVLQWISGLPVKAQVKCLARIRRLQQQGHQLRRPEADYLRDDIHELRISLQGLNYRILYFFFGKTMAVLSHSVTKERVVPAKTIEEAIERKRQFAQHPERHTYVAEMS